MTIPRRPHVVMVVQNDVSGDTRVKKMALTLAHAGCAVTVYGFSTRSERWETALGPVRIVRLADARRKRRGPRLRPGFRQAFAYRTPEAVGRAMTRREERRARLATGQAAWSAKVAQPRRGRGSVSALADRLLAASLPYRMAALRWAAMVPDVVVQVRLTATRGQSVTRKVVGKVLRRSPAWAPGRGTRAPTPRPPLAHLERLESLLRDELAGQDVDVIHAHDFFTIGMVHRAAHELSAARQPVRWVYDAHEYVRGLDFMSPERRAAALRLEAEHIRSADRVITVTPDLAERLTRDYGLPRSPDVVLNAPALLDQVAGLPSVRSRLRLHVDAPLLVYAGQVKAPRDVHTLVAALAYLPGAHLAVLTANDGPYVDNLAILARQLSAGDRYHRLPYVASHEVAAFLRDADVGVVPLSHYGNAEVALPTKLFEYLHAGLPMVVSDTRAMRRFATELGVGETYTAGDARSLAAAVTTVLDQPAVYRQRLQSQGLAQRYSWQRQEAVLIAAYRDVLGMPLACDAETPTSLEEQPVAKSTSRLVRGALRRAG